MTTKTDAKGHYAAGGLSLGIYRISVIEGGAVKSAANIKTAGSSARIDFDLKPSAKTIKHYVWVPGTTGSHMGGRWVQADANGSPVAGSYNSQRATADYAREMNRHQTNSKP